jgi:hypothetical protein
LRLVCTAGFGSIRTIKAETFATRWVANIWPSVGRSADTAVLTSKNSGRQTFKMKAPASFEKTFASSGPVYKDAVS